MKTEMPKCANLAIEILEKSPLKLELSIGTGFSDVFRGYGNVTLD